ncbi:hypothetical protein Tco_0311821 [Tanacetum coccineum]
MDDYPDMAAQLLESHPHRDKEDLSCPHRYFNKISFYDKKSILTAPTPVKAVEESCVTCGGAHSYQICPATTGNVYRDNIQEYVSQAAATNYNEGNTESLQPKPGEFQSSSSLHPKFIKGQIYRPQVVQTPAYQAPAYQAPAPQIQGVSKEDFQAYVKANDAVMRSMQTQDSSWFLDVCLSRAIPPLHGYQIYFYHPSYFNSIWRTVSFLLFEEKKPTSFLAIEVDPTYREVNPSILCTLIGDTSSPRAIS